MWGDACVCVLEKENERENKCVSVCILVSVLCE